MKIHWLLRPSRKPGKSIEGLFQALAPHVAKHVEFELVELPGSGNLKADFWLQRSFLKSLPKVDLVHVLGDVHYVAPWIPSPQVHTIHDLESLLQGNALSKKVKKFLWLQQAVKHAASVSVISAHTQEQFCNAVPQVRDKTRVIPNPLLLKPKGEFQKDTQFLHFLSVGTKANKNLERVAQALSQLSVSFQWHIVGALSREQQQFFTAIKLPFTNYKNLSSESLSELYAKAHVLLFPSLYEGFGLPILEAQAHGTVVLTSNITAMPEVAGTGAFLVDPMDTAAILSGIHQLVESKDLQTKLIAAGYENIKKYQIEAIADHYLTWYQEVVSAHSHVH